LLPYLSILGLDGEVMLPLFLFPVIVPVIIAAVKATGCIFAGGSPGEMGGWLNIFMSFDALFLVVAFIAFEYVLEE